MKNRRAVSAALKLMLVSLPCLVVAPRRLQTARAMFDILTVALRRPSMFATRASMFPRGG